jgi:hypothetical protein
LPAAVGYTTGMPLRYVRWIAAILALTAVYACWCHAPLIWDGAYQFNTTLIMQRPYYYLTRFHSFFLWWPTVWASRATSNVTLLQTIYGLPFLLGPFLGVTLSWWVVRRHAPHLLLWAIFGTCAGALPGQIFVINDSILTLHLFWPVFLGLFVPLTWPKRLVLAVLMVFQFVHPLGVLLLMGAAASAALVAAVDPSQRRRLIQGAVIMGALCLLAMTKIEITNHIERFRDTYAQQEATWANAIQRWHDAVSGLPLHGLACMWLAAVLAFVRPTLGRRPVATRLIGGLALLSVAIGAAYWVYWAHDARYWSSAIDYRRWVGPLTAPFMVLCALDVCRAALERREAAMALRAEGVFSVAVSGARVGVVSAVSGAHVSSPLVAPSLQTPPTDFCESGASKGGSDCDPGASRGALGLLLACTFALVLGMQCTIWARLTARLMGIVQNYPSVIVPDSDPQLAWVDGTPLTHWATGDYVTAVQAKQPAKVMLDWRSEKALRGKNPRVPHWDFYPQSPANSLPVPGKGGWFDFRPLLEQLAKEPPPAPRPGADRQDFRTVPN